MVEQDFHFWRSLNVRPIQGNIREGVNVIPGRWCESGANLVLNQSVFPLTPRFSAVASRPQPTQPFQRFLFAAMPRPGSR
jgi:hypothetical protein